MVKKVAEDKKPKGRIETSPKKGGKEKEDLPGTAAKLFGATGKEAFYLGDKAINNLQELWEHIDIFTEKEAEWLASWIEYLGDPKTAKKIRKKLPDFKSIIGKRHKQLKKHQKK